MTATAATFRYGSRRFTVSADDAAPIAWLREFLEPWFEPLVGPDVERDVAWDMEPRARQPASDHVAIHLRLDRALAEHLDRTATPTGGRPASCFVLDERLLRYRRHRDPSGTAWIRDTDLGTWYAPGPAGVRIVAGADGRGARVALMRVVRELAMHALADDGSRLLHAAGIERAGRVLVACGPRRAGKSTLLLRLLEEPGVRYLANDRVAMLAADPDAAAGADPVGGVVGRGLPTIVALRPGTVALLPALADQLARRRPDHWRTLAEHPGDAGLGEARVTGTVDRPVDLSPAQLCEAVGVEPAAAGTVAAIMFPMVDPAAIGIRLERLDRRSARDRLGAATVGAAFRRRSAQALAVAAPSGSGRRRPPRPRPVALSSIPAFAVHLGPDAFRPGTADGLLELLG